jgi:HlyD family secretion protein
MKLKVLITFVSSIIIISYLGYKIYNKFFKPKDKILYKTEQPQKRSIYQIIHATGILELKDNIKIGSLVSGTIEDIFVEENDFVKKEQILAEIKTGYADTDIKMAKGEFEKAKAEFVYQQEYYNRQKALFDSEQLSKNSFEEITKIYKKSKSDLKIKEANFIRKKMDFENTKITAPQDGIVVSIPTSKGARVTTSLETTLFEIAKDVTKMEAKLDIDESDIGQIKKEQKVSFSVSTYANKQFEEKIRGVSYSTQAKNGIQSYKAYVDVDNSKNLLRPGMTINAKIKVAECIDCLSITSQAFMINPKTLENIAKKLEYTLTPLSEKEKENIATENGEHYTLKYVWILDNKNFIEKAIKAGVTDDSYFEIKEGLNATDNVIIDVEEPDDMEALYKKWFGGSF